uniref:Kelch-like protein 33 n=1 Tax=Mastacembelus armatus TaxID=205130 RepID=A0A7N8YIT8_9TELE
MEVSDEEEDDVEQNLREETGRSEDGNIQNQEFTCYNYEIVKDKEQYEDPDYKSWENEREKIDLGAWTSKENNQEYSRKLSDAVKGLQDDHKKHHEEEESTDEEEEDHSMDDKVGSNDEDVVKIYSKDHHATGIFHTLTQFRDSSVLTDLTLNTEDGKSLCVHSPVLAAVSSFIWEHLRRCNEGKDGDSNVKVRGWSVSLGPEVDHVGLECVFEITSTALQLQHQPALSLCFTFLQQQINPHSCLDVASFAEAYEMVELLEAADDFVLRQFQKVACTSKFKDLPAKQLLKYLNSHSLCVPSELVVFKAVVTWIQAKPKKRLELAKELMKTVHFSLMTFKDFKEVQSLKMWSDQSLAELYEAVFQDFCSNGTSPQSQCRIYLPKESLVLIGGNQISEDLGSWSSSRELWFGNSLRNHTGIKKAMEWRKLGEMPEPARFSHEVAVFKGQLYVFGGKKYYGTGDTLNSVCRYDPLQNSWENLAEMQDKRCAFSVVVLDGKIYAIGGHCNPDYISSVEQYCPTANTWSFTWPLDLPLSGHIAKVLQGQIFVSGGLNSNYQCLASMFLYHPEKASTYLANMTAPRAHHCMEALGECLYVAGGISTDDNMSIIDQLACEVYNPAADSWTTFTSLVLPHVGAGSAVLEGKFYVLGGYSQEDYSDTKMVHRYDPTMQRWENMGQMPGPNSDIRASLLWLPPHFRFFNHNNFPYLG